MPSSVDQVEAAIPLALPVVYGIGALLVALGVTFATQEDYQDGVQKAWDSVSSDVQQNFSDLVSNPVGYTVDNFGYYVLPSSLRNIMEMHVHQEYILGQNLQSGDDPDIPVTVDKSMSLREPNAKVVEDGSGVDFRDPTIEPAAAGTVGGEYIFDALVLPNGIERIIIVDTESSRVQFTLPDGKMVRLRNVTYRQDYPLGTAPVQIKSSLRLINDDYWTVTFGGIKHVSGTSFHTWTLSGLQIYDDTKDIWRPLTHHSGGRFFYHVDGTNTYPWGDQTWPSVGNLIYDLVYGVDVQKFVDVYPAYMPGIGELSLDQTKADDIAIAIPQTWPQALEQTPAQVILRDATLTLPKIDTIPDTTDERINRFKVPSLIMTRFPFSIPWDLYNAFAMFSVPANSPKFEIPFYIPNIVNHTIIVDFERFNPVARISRWFFTAIFTLGLILITRKIIKG